MPKRGKEHFSFIAFVLLLGIIVFTELTFLNNKEDKNPTLATTPYSAFVISKQIYGEKNMHGYTENQKMESNLNAVTKKFNQRYWQLLSKPKTFNKDKVFTYNSLQNPAYNLWGPRKNITISSDRIIPQLVWQQESPIFKKRLKIKSILLWNGFKWWYKEAWKPNGIFKKKLRKSDCINAPNSLVNCYITEDRSKLNMVDAVILTKNWEFKNDIDVPENVLTFYYMLESPYNSFAFLNKTKQLLSTYWRGSDIVTPYRKWVYYDLNNKQALQEKSYYKSKTIAAAIFISNCNTPNNRLGFVHELQKYIRVDIYGKCGTMNCERTNNGRCNAMLKKDYYFYLAFENSNCRDYITEKLFMTAFDNDVVPIVLGAHPEDYKALAPYHSYIHVENFKTVEGLATYMKFLMQNEKAYNNYFKWKQTGEFIKWEFFCQLCAMVNYAYLVSPPKRTHPFEWSATGKVGTGNMCLKPKEWRWIA